MRVTNLWVRGPDFNIVDVEKFIPDWRGVSGPPNQVRRGVLQCLPDLRIYEDVDDARN